MTGGALGLTSRWGAGPPVCLWQAGPTCHPGSPPKSHRRNEAPLQPRSFRDLLHGRLSTHKNSRAALTKTRSFPRFSLSREFSYRRPKSPPPVPSKTARDHRRRESTPSSAFCPWCIHRRAVEVWGVWCGDRTGEDSPASGPISRRTCSSAVAVRSTVDRTRGGKIPGKNSSPRFVIHSVTRRCSRIVWLGCVHAGWSPRRWGCAAGAAAPPRAADVWSGGVVAVGSTRSGYD
jgi:hypothetical protein